MVRIFAPLFSALALSSAVLAAPMMGMNSEPSASQPESAVVSSSSSAMVHEATSTSAANAHATTSTSAANGHATTSTSAAMGHETTTSTAMNHQATTTAAAHDMTTSTSSAAAHTTAAPSYGSGSSNWGTDLNSCVQMCQAKFGGGLSSASAPPPSTTTAAPAAGTGATHTVIVAPTKGVLRYVPFAVNASVGDTVRFMWGAGPHTVTKSSALTVCNKTADAASFASGQQNASFVFDQVVNNTEPTFFFCAVPSHCQKGMFGIINPPSAPAGAATSVGAMMSTWTSQNPDLAKMQTAVDSMTINTPAYNWASNLDSSALPTEAHQSLVENIFYTRMFYAANTGADQGAARPDGQPISIPNDVNTLLTGTAGNPGGANGAPAGGVPSGTPTSAPANASPQASAPSANGAGSVAASSALIAVAAILSSLFLL